jgi:transglutaminase-like putative cysteine protease
MTFARDKRLLAGVLAFLAPLPLPFNGTIGWPALALYLLGVLWFLRRASLDPPRWLPTWGMNVLGVAYLPLFALDVFVLSGGRLVAPMLHLGLFAVLVKLFALVRERDKWQAAIGAFFLFLAAMGTSVHPSIVLYLAVFVAAFLTLLARFAFLHVLAGFGREDAALARVPLGGLLAAGTVGSLLLATPLFFLLPRLQTPFIIGRGGGGLEIEAAGFSDSVTLDSIGLIRNSRDVALRIEDRGNRKPEGEMRLKAATYELYEAGTWRRSPLRGALAREVGLRFRLAAETPRRWITIWLQPLSSTSLPLPVEAVVLEPPTTYVRIDQGGAVSLPIAPSEVVRYRVGIGSEPVLLALPPLPALSADAEGDDALATTGVTPRIAALAARVMGDGPAARRAARLEEHLLTGYTYTVSFVGRSAPASLESFLFEHKSGQCEYFASAMVLMLRSQGIPARLVTGFLGGEYNPFEGYYVVRDSNAHAWVEAYLPEQGGWRIFDPTPPAGRPGGASKGFLTLARQAWDFLIFRWDRYVLTYGIYDQLRVFAGLRDMWQDLLALFTSKGGGDAAAPAEAEGAPESAAEAPRAGQLPKLPIALFVGVLLAAATGLAAFFLRRRPLTATTAFQRVRRRLERGAPVPASAPPLSVARTAARRFPKAAPATDKIVVLYLRESFGGESLADDELAELKSALAEAEKGMRKAG